MVGAASAVLAAPKPGLTTGVVTDGILISAAPRSTHAALGGPVVVTGTLTNERPGKIALRTTDPLGGFRFIIHDPLGHLIQPNASGRHLLTLTRPDRSQMAPGEMRQQSVWISSLYDLKKTGRYTISLTHSVPSSNGLGSETARSNSFIVTITK